MSKLLFLLSMSLVLVLLGDPKPAPSQSQSSVVNKLPIQRIEMGLRLGQPSLRIRLHLQSGQAIDHQVGEGPESHYVLGLARMLAAGEARLFAEIANNELVGIQAAVP